MSYSAIDLQESKHKSYIYMYVDAAERVMKLLRMDSNVDYQQ